MNKKDILTYALIACMSAAAGATAFLFQNENAVAVVKTPIKYPMNKQPIGSLVPNLQLTDTQQKKSSLYDYKNDYLLINFWATWCAPCRREMPILKSLNDNNEHLTVLGFSYDKDEAIEAFKDKIDIDYPLFQNTHQTAKLNALFGNQSGGLPYTVLLDKDYKIMMTHTGEISEKQILNYLK